MPNVISMSARRKSAQQDPELPNYAGRFLCLNPEKATTFQCGGFLLGPRRVSAVVPANAQMEPIERALQAGVLLDITTGGEIKTEHFALQSPVEDDTNKKVYFTEVKGEMVAFGTENPAEQERLDAQVARGKLELPPGFEDEDKYLLKLPAKEPPKCVSPRKAALTEAEQAALARYRKLKPSKLNLWGRLRKLLGRKGRA
jgi:hypothetical protein